MANFLLMKTRVHWKVAAGKVNKMKVSNKKENMASDYADNKQKPTPVAMVAPELKQSAASTEITKTCAVLGCENYKKLDPTYSFFRFPEEPNLRQIWVDLTGRNNWTPTDYSYVCIQHFSVDSFEADDEGIALNEKAVPSIKLPGHVLEVEYIDEETLDNEEHSEMDFYHEPSENFNYEDEEANKIEEEFVTQETIHNEDEPPTDKQSSSKQEITEENKSKNDVELLKLFTEVQKMQRHAVSLKDKLQHNMKIHNRQNRRLEKIKQLIEIKKKVLNQKRKKKSRILLSIQDKIKEDRNGLALAMPMKQTEDLKNFALSIYKYSPQAYIYIRNTLRTMLPGTDTLEAWVEAGYQPKNVLNNNNLIKITAEQTDKQLVCRVSLS